MSLHDYKSAYQPPPPRGLQTVGMLLFLAALFMLFTSSMLAYVFIRINTSQPIAPHTIQPPQLLWISTALILGVSVCFHGALKSVRRERQATMRRWLVLAVVCAAGFIVVQTPALVELLREHYRYMNELQAFLGQLPSSPEPGSPQDLYMKQLRGQVLMYGLIFVFILLHALHVLGGMIAMAVIVRHGFRGVYDHEHHFGLSNAAMYWHFLDVVWLAMFSIFWFLG